MLQKRKKRARACPAVNPPFGRSIRLDIVDVNDAGAGAKRARYNSSLIDANVTEAGDDCKNLAETYVIFITEHDVLKGGLPIYHVDRMIREMNCKLFEDEAHIIYVNSQIKDETAPGKLMHDFYCINANDMKCEILANRVRYFKEDAEGVAAMCKIMEDMRREAAQEAAQEERYAIAKELLSMGGLVLEPIAQATKLSLDEVKQLAEQRTV